MSSETDLIKGAIMFTRSVGSGNKNYFHLLVGSRWFLGNDMLIYHVALGLSKSNKKDFQSRFLFLELERFALYSPFRFGFE